MSRVCYIGNFEPEYSTENDVRKAFEHLGHEVIKIQENKIIMPMLEEEALKSDLVLITSTWDTAMPLTWWMNLMKKLADNNIPSATLHLDTFWSTPRNNRTWWLNPMFHTAYIFTADGDYQEKWKLLGKNHIWLPPAVRHDAAHFGTFREEYACDVAFVGSNGVGYHESVWPYRRELVDALRSMCQKNGWSFNNPGGDDPKVDRGEDLNDFYASAKITVGDSLCLKKQESHYWSDRVPEATGRGGFLIMPHIDLLSGQGWNIPRYRWGDFDMLETMLKHFLHQDSARERMKHYNMQRTSDKHTYVNRVQTILKEVGL